jgi:hypothetical protein
MTINSKFNINELVKFSDSLQTYIGYIREVRHNEERGEYYLVEVDDYYYDVDRDRLSLIN